MAPLEEYGLYRSFLLLLHRKAGNKCWRNGTQITGSDSKAAWAGVCMAEPSPTLTAALPIKLTGSDSKAAFDGVAIAVLFMPLLPKNDLETEIFV
jgi:hypothetical protein